MNLEILTACDRAANAALNGVVWGILLTVAVGCSLRVLRRLNAATRHAVWCGTLLWLAVLIPAQLWKNRAGAPVSSAAIREGGVGTEAALTAPSDQETVAGQGSDAPADAESLLGSIQSQSSLAADQSRPSSATLRERLSRIAARVILLVKQASRNLELGFKAPRFGGAVLVGLWLVVAGGRVSAVVWRLSQVRGLKKASLSASAELQELFEKLRSKLRVKRRVQLRVSPLLPSAIVVGFRRPAILFPVEDGQTPRLDLAEQVLAHELAHVNRADDWVNLMQHLAQAVLFFHPAVWWISRQLALEREIACDDIVLAHGGRAQSYALLLVDLAGRAHGSQPGLAPGVSTGRSQLHQRITMILNPHRNTSPRLAKIKLGFMTAATASVALLVLYGAPRFVLAENLNADTASNALPAPVARLDIAQTDLAPASAPEDIGRGPKFKKPDGDDNLPAQPAPPREPARARTRPARASDSAPMTPDIEARLDRLEKMVRSLATQVKRGRPDGSMGDLRDLKEQMSRPEESQIDAKRETARAAEAEKRAAKLTEKAKKAEDKLREKGGAPDGFQFDFQSQIQVLHQQREALQRAVEKLDRQIERLQREHEHLDHQPRGHGHDDAEEPGHKG